MTTIIVKNANFAGGKLLHYEPPVSDLKVCAWIGGDDAVCLRNFGTLGDLLMPSSTPVQQADGLFRRFNGTAFLTLPLERKTSMTVIAVTRDTSQPPSGAQFAYVLSSERDSGIDGHNYNGGRRGFSFLRRYNNTVAGAYEHAATNFGDSAGAVFSITSQITNPEATPLCVKVESQPSTTGTSTKVYRLTAAAANSSLASSANATTLPDPDEAGYPMRVGLPYRTNALTPKDLDIAFLAVADRILTQAESDALFASIKRRFTAFGMTI